VCPFGGAKAATGTSRHGHKTSARGFDGYKGHIAVDPDSEIITATAVTPGNSGDAEAAAGLLADLLPGDQDHGAGGTASPASQGAVPGEGQPAVYGDAAYGSGDLLEQVEEAGIHAGIKVQPPAAPSPPARPKVERKIGHLMRRRHGGRRARVRGQLKAAANFALLAAAVNLARLAVPGLASHTGNWTVPAS
jgi:Transposase DDE domain